MPTLGAAAVTLLLHNALNYEHDYNAMMSREFKSIGKYNGRYESPNI